MRLISLAARFFRFFPPFRLEEGAWNSPIAATERPAELFDGMGDTSGAAYRTDSPVRQERENVIGGLAGPRRRLHVGVGDVMVAHGHDNIVGDGDAWRYADAVRLAA